MFKLKNKLAIIFIGLTYASCTEIVEPVNLEGLVPDPSLQEEFEINVEPLNFETAKKLNDTPYRRVVSKLGSGQSAGILPEDSLLNKSFPPNNKNYSYKLGVGDEIALIQYSENSPSLGMIDGPNNSTTRAGSKTQNSNIISTTGRIGSDGSLLLIGVGRINALDREISELRNEVRNILIRNGKIPNFQLEIASFNSQTAYVTSDLTLLTQPDANLSAASVKITDKRTTLRELLANAGTVFSGEKLTVIRLQRGALEYRFTLADLFSKDAPDIYLQDKDHIFLENLAYKTGKVFLLGGVNPSVIEIKPEARETLADALFHSNGPLATASAQRSAVYLIRGRSPVIAYHLDARNPLRVMVADTVELRPNDIVFVAEQPITTFNRSLSNIIPLRGLLRDLERRNIP